MLQQIALVQPNQELPKSGVRILECIVLRLVITGVQALIHEHSFNKVVQQLQLPESQVYAACTHASALK